jgi:hypothetical protein
VFSFALPDTLPEALSPRSDDYPSLIPELVEKFESPYEDSPLGEICYQILQGIRGIYIFEILRLVYLLNQPYWKDYIQRFADRHPACGYFANKCDIVDFLRDRGDSQLTVSPDPIRLSNVHYINTFTQKTNPLLTFEEIEFLNQAMILFSTHKHSTGCTSDLAFTIESILDFYLPSPFKVPWILSSEHKVAFDLFALAATVERECCKSGVFYQGPIPQNDIACSKLPLTKRPFTSSTVNLASAEDALGPPTVSTFSFTLPSPQNPGPRETFWDLEEDSELARAYKNILQGKRSILIFAIHRLVYLLNKPYWKDRIHELPSDSNAFKYFTQECDIDNFLRTRNGVALVPPSSPIYLLNHCDFDLQRERYNPLLTWKEAEFFHYVHVLFFASQTHSSLCLAQLACQAAGASQGIHLSYPLTLTELIETYSPFSHFFRDAAQVDREYV